MPLYYLSWLASLYWALQTKCNHQKRERDWTSSLSYKFPIFFCSDILAKNNLLRSLFNSLICHLGTLFKYGINFGRYGIRKWFTNYYTTMIIVIIITTIVTPPLLKLIFGKRHTPLLSKQWRTFNVIYFKSTLSPIVRDIIVIPLWCFFTLNIPKA